jgi:hypothetical protein
MNVQYSYLKNYLDFITYDNSGYPKSLVEEFKYTEKLELWEEEYEL